MPPMNRKYKRPARKGPDQSSWTDEEKRAYREKELLKTPVAEMRLPVRVINTLEENGVILAAQLMEQTYESLLVMRNFGEKTLREVRAAITALGLTAPEWKKPPKEKKPPKPRGGKGKDLLNMW